MAEQREIYKGKTIVVQQDDGLAVTIDDQLVELKRDEASKQFFSGRLPYLVFETAMDLAKAYIDEGLT